MGTPFRVIARTERRSAPAGASTMWAALRIDPDGPQLERERAPLALALVIDVSSSMAGDPIAHVLRSCEIVANLLDARDQLAIVTFGTQAGVRCGLTAMDEAGKALIRAAIRDVAASGSTNLHAGLEAGAGVLAASLAGGDAAAAPRRALVVMSDGQPNIGLTSAAELAGLVKSLGIATSALGFGLHHDDVVLDAIATAGSGRYTYVPDPQLARVDLARAALAHAGVVADHLEVAIELAPGVEIARVVPTTQLRVGGGGVRLAVGDVFLDEGRLLAIELQLDLRAGATGKLATCKITGVAADGSRHTVSAPVVIDVHAGPHAVDRDGQRDVALVLAEAARGDARAHIDRGAAPAAISVLREAQARIEACEGFVAGDGTPLAELREQLIDEIANYERRATAAERSHQAKGSRHYKSQVVSQRSRTPAPVRAQLVGVSDNVRGSIFELFDDTSVGRTNDNEIVVPHSSLSRRHTRFVFVDGAYMVQDMGSTNGTKLNGKLVDSCALADRDEIAIGDIIVRFEIL
jgi:Ca-activated chloride channel family protein